MRRAHSMASPAHIHHDLHESFSSLDSHLFPSNAHNPFRKQAPLTDFHLQPSSQKSAAPVISVTPPVSRSVT
eukprot:1160641-Pelagomonas_calceolata.AAC.17